jgi:Uncharacterized protein conserved in archaea, COG1888
MIRKLVLDVLKPIKGPSIVEMAEKLSKIEGVEGVNISVTDMDVETMGLIVVIEGNDIPYAKVRELIEEMGSALHSIDEVVSGNKMVEGTKRK